MNQHAFKQTDANANGELSRSTSNGNDAQYIYFTILSSITLKMNARNAD